MKIKERISSDSPDREELLGGVYKIINKHQCYEIEWGILYLGMGHAVSCYTLELRADNDSDVLDLYACVISNLDEGFAENTKINWLRHFNRNHRVLAHIRLSTYLNLKSIITKVPCVLKAVRLQNLYRLSDYLGMNCKEYEYVKKEIFRRHLTGESKLSYKVCLYDDWG